MARIISLADEARSTPPNKRVQSKTQPRTPVSYSIITVPLFAIFISAYSLWKGLLSPPLGSFGKLLDMSPALLRTQAGLPPQFGQSWDTVLPHPFDKLPYVTHIIFKDVAESRLALGLVVILSTVATPWFTAALIESIKPRNSSHPGLSTFILASLVGMSLMVGFVAPAVYVPLLSYRGWYQASISPTTIRPLPSPPVQQVLLVLASVLVSGLPIVLLFLIPPVWSKAFFWNVMTMPWLPVAWAGLFFIKQPPAPSRSSQPRLAASNTYRWLAYATVPFWWYGLFRTLGPLREVWRSGKEFPSDASSLLFWDNVGLLVGAYAMVLVQAGIDFQAVQCGGPRVHRARFFMEDLVFGSTGTLLLGPGFGFAMYFARREVLAEKARFGVAPVFAG